MRLLACLLVALPALVALDLPPGPADPALFPGQPLARAPQVAAWPAVATSDASWLLTLSLPVPQDEAEVGALGYRADSAGSLSWQAGITRRFRLPGAGAAVQSLVIPLPDRPGQHRLQLDLAKGHQRFPVHVLDATAAAWPALSWEAGRCRIDDQPCTLLLPTAQPRAERLAAWRGLPPATGPACLVGDPLAALGRDLGDLVPGLTVACDSSGHAFGDARLLPWLAGLASPLPRAIVWSPGDEPLRAGRRWRDEELWLRVIQERCLALGQAPRLILLLPPLPAEPSLAEAAQRRRRCLRATALDGGWEVLDAAASLPADGDPRALAAGLRTSHPNGPAQAALAATLATTLDRPADQQVLELALADRLLVAGETAWAVVRLHGRLLDGAATVALDEGPPQALDIQADGSLARWLAVPATIGEHRLQVQVAGRSLQRSLRLADVSTIAEAVDPQVLVAYICRERQQADGAWQAGDGLLLGIEPRSVPGFASRPLLSADGQLATDWPTEPRSLIVWEAGSQAALPHSEHRLIDAIAWQAAATQPDARLLLVLPAGDDEASVARRQVLGARAFAAGWLVLDPQAWPEPLAAVLATIRDDPLAAVRAGMQIGNLPTSFLYRGDRWSITVEQDGRLLDGAARLADGGSWQTFDLHDDGRARAYLALDATAGQRDLQLRSWGLSTALSLRVADLQQGWPVATCDAGRPRDAAGHDLILMRDHDADAGARRWQLLDAWGATAQGSDAYWGGAAAAAIDPNEAVWDATGLSGLAMVHELVSRQPRCLYWMPAAAELDGPVAMGQASRMLELVRLRLRQASLSMELMLVIPAACPAADRAVLTRQALFHDWQVRVASAP